MYVCLCIKMHCIHLLLFSDEGTHFTITALSCINYTAVFSWNLEVNVADTQLELSCHNESSVSTCIYIYSTVSN